MRGDEDTELIMLERHEERKEHIHKSWYTHKYDMHRLVNMSADFIYLSLFSDVYCTFKEA